MVPIVGTNQNVDIRGFRFIIRWGNSKFDIRYQQVDFRNTTVSLEFLKLGIVRNREVVGNAEDPHFVLSFNSVKKFIPVPKLVVERWCQVYECGDPIAATPTLYPSS